MGGSPSAGLLAARAGQPLREPEVPQPRGRLVALAPHGDRLAVGRDVDAVPDPLRGAPGVGEDLGSVDKMKEDFTQAGVTQFGSGWCWLAVKDGKLAVMKTANGESPLVHGATPILGVDVWEHS